MHLILKHFLPKKYSAIAIYPFIIVSNAGLLKDKKLMNHENIHLQQQIELCWILFFIWYGIEFLFRVAFIHNWHLAYRAISFEKEAYLNQDNLKYLQSRKTFSFLKYL